MEQSQYSRRESGTVRIKKREWDKLAQLLNTKLEDIYEPEDGVYIINNEVASGEYSGSHNFFNIPNDLWKITQKYIKKLEEENQRLRERWQYQLRHWFSARQQTKLIPKQACMP